MPAPVRCLSTAAVFDEGGADRDHPGARQWERAPAPEFGHWFDHRVGPVLWRCRSKCVHLAPAAGSVRGRSRRSP
jgi:hypothetical protein